MAISFNHPWKAVSSTLQPTSFLSRRLSEVHRGEGFEGPGCNSWISTTCVNSQGQMPSFPGSSYVRRWNYGKSSKVPLRKLVTWILLLLFWSRITSMSCCHSSQSCAMRRYWREGLPESQRTAIVVPRLKGSGLDPADVKSHRPISNLSFMSKVIERVIFRQLVVYLDSNNLVPKYQSGFRKHHSTESATLRVLSDIYSAIDNGRIALLALLDISAAFDTVDHDILMHRLSESFGIVGQAHDWLSSFVTCRTYSVRFGGIRWRFGGNDIPVESTIWYSAGIDPRTVVVHIVHSGCRSARGIPGFQSALIRRR